MIWNGKKRLATATLLLGLMLSATTQAHAAVVYYTTQASFTAAQSGNTFIGTENFEESTLPANNFQYLTDPLQKGVANGSFPAGLVQPLTVQSNTLGGNATTTSPRGSGGMIASGPGVNYVTSHTVFSANTADSLDLIFSPTQRISSIGFNPVTFGSNAVPVQVQVYDINNILLGTTTTSTAAGGTTYYGIQATGADLIGRVNLLASGTNSGVDNISIYQAASGTTATPEPTTWAMMAMGVIAMLVLAKRRKREEDEPSLELAALAL